MSFLITLSQLTAETIATILNGAYLNSEAISLREGTSEQFKYSKVTYDGWEFIVYVGEHNALVFKHYQLLSLDYDENELRRIAIYMNRYPVGSTYMGKTDDRVNHVMAFHYSHILPEDETISPAYLVKLCRHFAKTLGFQAAAWSEIRKGASVDLI